RSWSTAATAPSPTPNWGNAKRRVSHPSRAWPCCARKRSRPACPTPSSRPRPRPSTKPATRCRPIRHAACWSPARCRPRCHDAPACTARSCCCLRRCDPRCTRCCMRRSPACTRCPKQGACAGRSTSTPPTSTEAPQLSEPLPPLCGGSTREAGDGGNLAKLPRRSTSTSLREASMGGFASFAPICPSGIFPRRRGKRARLRGGGLGRGLPCPGGFRSLGGGRAGLGRGRVRGALRRRLLAGTATAAAVAHFDHLSLPAHFEQVDRFDQVTELAVAVVARVERALVADVAA